MFIYLPLVISKQTIWSSFSVRDRIVIIVSVDRHIKAFIIIDLFKLQNVIVILHSMMTVARNCIAIIQQNHFFTLAINLYKLQF